MRVVDEINKLVKKAQAFVKFYPDDVYRDGAKNIIDTVKKVPNALWGTLGVGAGLAKGVADRKWRIPFAPMAGVPSPMVEVGKGKPEGSWGDYVRAGWDAGYNNGDIAAAGLVEGMANGVPFADFKAPSRFADFVQKEKVDSGMDPEIANTMRNRANYAGYGVDLLPTMAAWGLMGKATGAAGGAIGRTVAPLMKADPAKVEAIAEKFGPWAIEGWLMRDIPGAVNDVMPWSKTNSDIRKMEDALKMLDDRDKKIEYARSRLDYGPLTDAERRRRYEEYLDLIEPGWRNSF